MLEFNTWIDDIIKYEIKLKALFLIHIAFLSARPIMMCSFVLPPFWHFTYNILGLAINYKYMIFRINPNAAVKYK